ncbi:MAG: MG2 domain-containing protein, partial [Gammaproteobacteria bacterium]|nr:MG2 domain-containing protein [Gammaproteobacteria bacterium]
GSVSRNSHIEVNFVRDIVSEARIGTDASAAIELSPAVDAEIVYEGLRKIRVKPKGTLQPGAVYEVQVVNSALEALPEALGNYSFTFQVIPRDFEVRINPLSSSEKTILLSGVVVTSDAEDKEAVESLLMLEVPGQQISLSWEHDAAGTYHNFFAQGIQRDQQEKTITLIWSGNAMGVDRAGEQSLVVPPVGEFKITRVAAVDASSGSGRRYVEVRFSENIDAKQNLKGLIQLGDTQFTTRVEGNRLSIYPNDTDPGGYTVSIEKGIKSESGTSLIESVQRDVYFEMQDPMVRFRGKGVILPQTDVLSVPFETINVKSVKVTAFRIYDDNMGQFLQQNKLEGGSDLGRVGRYLWRKNLDLGAVEPNTWNRFSVDVTELLQSEPGALFRLTLSIDRGDSILTCAPSDTEKPVESQQAFSNHDDINLSDNSGWDYADYYYNPNAWQDRRNPCKDAYYKHSDKSRAHKNYMASNIGLIAKRGPEGTLAVTVTDIVSAMPMAGVKVDVRNFQDQSLGTIETDAEGFARLKTEVTPFYLIASKGKDYGYLKINAATALPMSHFDVGGEKIKQGIKGTIYGERGVWRPGDNIYLTFVLEDKNNVIPDDHPVTMQLYDPKGQLVQSRTNAAPMDGFYTFRMKTLDTAITGNWTAKALLGGNQFTRQLKIETVIPNRLKIETTFENDSLAQSDMPVKGHLFSQWLHGADAKHLKTDIAVRLVPKATGFTRNADFAFDDPAREFSGESEIVYEGRLDETGNRDFEVKIQAPEQAAGMLTAHFTTRVFEEGGNFSTSQSSMPYHPYDHYVGIKVPEGDAARNMLLTDTTHTVEIASLDKDGEPVSLPAVEVSVYKISWKWWWDQSGDNLANYVRSSYNRFIKRDLIATENGIGTWTFDIKYPDWGRYLVRACDINGKHCSGKIIYVDWPGWAGRAKETGGAGANALTLQSDKARYKVGDTAMVTLPAATQGRALISLETGSRILDQQWIVFSEQQIQFPVKITKDMSPNAYVSVTLVQPHQGKDNDRPVRLYGVVPLKVENPLTMLEPELLTTEEWMPATVGMVKVSEAKGQPMTYTLAVVDEGLLGLTNFKTPDLHKQFYRKEALGVLSWDLFDQIAGAYGGELERLLSLGGDDEAEEDQASQEQKRFPPVVRFMGPFRLAANGSNEHRIDIPQYIGAVRVMLVAGEVSSAAYGSADTTVFVRGNISLLATVPRVIGPEEMLSVPVALFTMKEEIKEVRLSSEVSEHFEQVGEGSQILRFDAPGEQLGQLTFRVKPTLGKGRLKFVAS